MKKRSVSVLLIFLMLCSIVGGCTAKPVVQEGTNQTEVSKEEMILNYNLAEDPRTLDPQLNSSIKAGDILNNTYEGLMREIDGKLVPGIAQSYKISDDGLTYTFYLRESKWSDGVPLTADDFVYSWVRAADPETASDYAGLLYYIKGGYEFFNEIGKAEDVAVKAIDEKTLEVTLVNPTPFFLDLTAFYTFLPVRKDVVEMDTEGWAKNPEIIVSNGPFKLVEYSIGDKIVLEKNDNYWNAEAVKLDRIVCDMIIDESTALTAYESGDIDITPVMPLQEIPRLMREDPTFHIRPQIGTNFYVFNVKKPPVDDVRVRKALTLAIDRKSLVENIIRGGEVPAIGFVPPGEGMKDTRGNVFRDTAPDYGLVVDTSKVDEAKELLAEAGYPEGKGFPEIEILYNTSGGNKAIAEAIQEMWKKNLGINTTLLNQEWAVFANTRRNGQFIIARHNWIGDYSDPMTFLDLFSSEGGNTSAQWISQEYNDLLNTAKRSSDPEERDQALYAAEKLLFDDQVLIPLYHHTDKMLVKQNVVGWNKTTLGNWFFGNTTITE